MTLISKTHFALIVLLEVLQQIKILIIGKILAHLTILYSFDLGLGKASIN